MAEVEGPPKKYGFQIDSITPDFMSSVVKIYQDAVGKTYGSTSFMEQLASGIDDIKKELTNNGYSERRLGSKLDYNSKLTIRVSHPDNLCLVQFNPNLNVNEDAEIKDEATQMKNKFESQINEFLISSGQGTELKNLT
jgi:hypothetical protein